MIGTLLFPFSMYQYDGNVCFITLGAYETSHEQSSSQVGKKMLQKLPKSVCLPVAEPDIDLNL